MENSFVCVVGYYPNELASQQCAFELSMQNEKVYESEATFQGFFENKTYEVIDTGCADGAVFNNWFGSNEDDAKECALKLNQFRKRAGKPEDVTFAAVPLCNCALFANEWMVIKVNSDGK